MLGPRGWGGELGAGWATLSRTLRRERLPPDSQVVATRMGSVVLAHTEDPASDSAAARDAIRRVKEALSSASPTQHTSALPTRSSAAYGPPVTAETAVVDEPPLAVDSEVLPPLRNEPEMRWARWVDRKSIADLTGPIDRAVVRRAILPFIERTPPPELVNPPKDARTEQRAPPVPTVPRAAQSSSPSSHAAMELPAFSAEATPALPMSLECCLPRSSTGSVARSTVAPPPLSLGLLDCLRRRPPLTKSETPERRAASAGTPASSSPAR